MMDIIKNNLKKNIIIIILLLSQIPIFPSNNQSELKKVIIKESGNFIYETYLKKGNLLTIRPTIYNYDFPEYSYIYENEDIIDYKCIKNKLYINGTLRGLTINNADDVNLINENTNTINLNIKIDPGISEKLMGINKKIFLSIDDDVFRAHDLLKIKDLKNLSHLSLYDINSDHNFQNIKYFTNLEYLNISSSNLKNKDLESLKYFNKLKSLNLHGLYNIDNDSIKHLQNLTSIEELNLSGTKISNEGLQYIRSMKNLKYLNLKNSNISGEGLKYIKDLKQLQTLILSKTKISNIGLKYISSLTNLESLSLILCKNFNDNGTKYLGSLKKLKFLYLDYNDLTDNGMAFIKEFKNLEVLRISRLDATSESIKYIKDLKKLKILNLEDIKLNNSDIKYITDKKDLEELYLENTGIDDKDIEYLANNLKKITTLYLNYTKITDESLKYISNLSELKEINISNTKVTNEGIKYLTKLKKLDSFYATDTHADGFEHLLFVSKHAYKYYSKQKRLTYKNAMCIKSGTEVRSGIGAAYSVINTLKKDEEVTILESASLKNSINYELLIDYYDEVNDLYIKKGTILILIEQNEDKYLIAVEKNNKKYLISIDKEYLKAEYSFYLSNDLYFYKIQTKDGKIGYVNYKFIKKRDSDPSGDTMKELRLFHILVNDEKTAKDILIKIQTGESFEELAKKYSICSSNMDGGDLGWVDNEFLIHEIKNKVNYIYYPGRLSRIIKSEYGYHIVLVKGIMLKNQGYRFVFSY